jgi:hypothetical protein
VGCCHGPVARVDRSPVGSVYGLAATGLVLPFKTSRILNFAYGPFRAPGDREWRESYRDRLEPVAQSAVKH